ncbi:MAG: hypothetical protein U0J70_10640 [Atopobiaceae bacterium]|nr:hypothetical protein [Atopobiaceae bacterium]
MARTKANGANRPKDVGTTYGGRPRMSLEDRAKIFVPFDPLAGFREALRVKEREAEARNLEEWEK